ncbi:hypothetical protein MTBSS4_130025 [Magnetospirillum sp. SS-4]|nr:hypothetical protein MTBSS4_130025 [Magnetospirillum sp. SS-4]
MPAAPSRSIPAMSRRNSIWAACSMTPAGWTRPRRASAAFSTWSPAMWTPLPISPVSVRTRAESTSLYSWHRRYVGGGHDFRDYLDRTVMSANHMPVVLGARPLLIYALFAAYWLAGRRKPILVVRFEDIKQRPVEVVGGILDFLGLQRDEGRIRDSVVASDVGGLIKAHANDPTFKMARHGMAGEWREHMSTQEWAQLTSAEPVRSVCAMLGYGPPGGGGRLAVRRFPPCRRRDGLRRAGRRFPAARRLSRSRLGHDPAAQRLPLLRSRTGRGRRGVQQRRFPRTVRRAGQPAVPDPGSGGRAAHGGGADAEHPVHGQSV